MTRIIREVVAHAVFSAGSVDAHGNPVESWGTASDVGVWFFAPGSTDEPREPGGDRVVVEPTLYAPESVVFSPQDRVTVRGLLYEVEGVTRVWQGALQSNDGNVIGLRRVEG